jgi:hypothetical protein
MNYHAYNLCIIKNKNFKRYLSYMNYHAYSLYIIENKNFKILKVRNYHLKEQDD